MRSKLEFPMRQIFRRQRESLRKFSEKMQIPKATQRNGCVCGRACRQCSDHGLACLGVDRTLLANEMAPESEDKEEFDANGIVIPYNQMEVYVHQQK